MSVSAIQAGTPAAKTNQTNMGSVMGKDDFLKLFVTQLKHQDPMSPTQDKEFMGQMAQFSQLEQTTNIAEAMAALSFSGKAAQATGLIGRTVEWELADGTKGSGAVDKITFADGEISVHAGANVITQDQIRSVT
jgi:flagellar basal-body rod modification protein FlgD